ncbi:MAG: hypothetical protein NXI16_12525 [Alphaproteobacteria bacterium]|nr:hypothetical protein [Alphaproteobacteria bacterium]
MVDNTIGGPGSNPAIRPQTPLDRQDAAQRRQTTDQNASTGQAADREEALQLAGGTASALGAARAESQSRAQTLADTVLSGGDGSVAQTGQDPDPFLTAVINAAEAQGFGPVDTVADNQTALNLANDIADSLGGGGQSIANANPQAIGTLLGG